MEKANAQVESDRTERTVADSMLMNYCKGTDQNVYNQRTHTWYFNIRVSAISKSSNRANLSKWANTQLVDAGTVRVDVSTSADTVLGNRKMWRSAWTPGRTSYVERWQWN
jgi:hypothetical protein